ncbi:MAG: F0F1 ATP synthase subunit A [Acidobacteriaceae bacterium]|nr:F0F1 ATP synthase subunit A [Acidobacteriaceae bacterium]
MEHQLWITGIVNHAFAGPANAILDGLGVPANDPSHPWTDWMVCEVLVVLFMLVLFAALRPRLSVHTPGKLQHTMELTYEFVRASAEEVVGQAGIRYLPFFGAIFLFILAMNLIGLIPGLESPTMYPMVPFGLAVVTVVLYHYAGIREQGPRYIRQFLGPFWWLVWLMLPIEVISQLARPLSLTVRLFANMFAGEQVYVTFVALTKLIVPVIFIGLHFFVGFLQAYIFMLLAMVYVGGAVAKEE